MDGVINMKKTLLKMELVFLCLFLLFFLCVQTSISEYQYGGQITSSDMSLQPPAFMECTSLGAQTIGNSYTIRDTALNVIKAEHGAMLGFVDFKTLAEQFTSGVNIESAGNVVPAADPAALPAKAEAQVVANAAIIVDPVNQGRSPTMLQFGVEAAQSGLTAASGKSPVPIAAVDNNGLVRTEGIQQEPEPVVIVQSSNLPKAEPQSTLSEVGTGTPDQVGITQNVPENRELSAIQEKEQSSPNIPDAPVGQTKQTQESEKNIFKIVTDLIFGATPKTPAGSELVFEKASKSTNPTINANQNFAINQLSLIEGEGKGAAKYNESDLAIFATLKEGGLSGVKSLISELGQASPSQEKHIEFFIASVYYAEAEPEIKNQILDLVLDELQHNSSSIIRKKMPAILSRIYTTLNLFAAIDMCSPLNTPGAKKILDSLIYSLQNDPSVYVRFQAGFELVHTIANPEALPIITNALCTDPVFHALSYPRENGTHALIANEFSAAFNVNAIVPELIPYLGNKDTSKRAIALLAAIGQPAAEPLLMLVGDKDSDPVSVENAVAALYKIGSTAFALPLCKIINNIMLLNSVKIQIMEKVTRSYDFDVIRTELQWEKLASDTSATPLIRAIAFSKIIKNAAFHENHVFDTISSNGSLSGLKQIAVEEFIGILASGIPAKQDWWGRIDDRGTKTEYVQQIFAADMTDQRHFHKGTYNIILPISYRNWVCEQFATQVVMNSTGWNSDSWADQDGFTDYGAGYTNYSINDIAGGYGMPIHCAVEVGGRHTFNAIFMGDDFNNQSQRLDYQNWCFKEPQDDSPVKLSNTEIKIFPTAATFFFPDGFLIHDDDYILLKVPTTKR